MENKTFNVSTRIREKFEKFFDFFQKNHSRFFSNDFNRSIKSILSESRGLKLPNFTDTLIFHMIMSYEIDKVALKVDELIDECKDSVLDILLVLSEESFSSYPALNKGIQNELKNSVNDQVLKAMDIVHLLFKCETQAEWTINPYYTDIIMKVKAQIAKKKEDLVLWKLMILKFLMTISLLLL